MDLPPLTPDQITGSPVLKMLRQTVAKRGLDQTVTAESVARAEKGFEFIEQVVMALRATGDPDAIRAAANIQADAIESIIINKGRYIVKAVILSQSYITIRPAHC